MPNFSKVKTFDGKNYEIKINFIYDEISLSNPLNNVDVDKTKNVALVLTEGITYVMLENSISKMWPTLEMEVMDTGKITANYIKNNNTKIAFECSTSYGDENKSIKLTFIVNTVNVKFETGDTIVYRIMADLDLSFIFGKVIDFSSKHDSNTQINANATPYEMAWDILNKAGYPLYQLQQVNDDGNLSRSIYSLPEATNTLDFITCAHEMNVSDAVKYLLSYAVDEKNIIKPAYLVFNLLDGKGHFATFDKFLSKEYIDCVNPTLVKALTFSSSTTNGVTDSVSIMTDIDTSSLQGGVNGMDLFFNYRFNEYDHESGKWTTYEISKEKLNKLLTKGIDESTEESIFAANVKEDKSVAKFHDYPPHSHPIMYDVLRNLELYSSFITFTVGGYLGFDVGHVINIGNEGNNGSSIEMFSGRWVIIKVQHSFRNQSYRTHITCARTFYTKQKN